MLQKPKGCEGCPLEQKGKGFCKDKPAKKPRYLFIGEAPGKNEIDKGEPFIGKAGFVLENWLVRAVSSIQLAKEKGEIMYANTLRCLPPEIQGRPYPKGEERLLAEAHCRQYDDFPESVHTVVLFGDSPQRCWFGEEIDAEDAAARRLGRDTPGVMGRVGRELEKSGKRWVFAPHPAFILRQPALVGHGQNALKIASNTEQRLEPEYVKWNEAIGELCAI
jgi:uracil-DNA glycosylase